jgi:hypothetical protein
MPLRVSFNLGDEDLRHFEEVAQQTQAIAREQPADAIIASAARILESGESAHAAAFVRERFARLRAMIDMATDPDWQPREEDRQRIINALACFGTPAGKEGTAGVGLLDHGIMIELVSRDLEHDIEAYQTFSKFRASQLTKRRRPGIDQDEQRDQWLAQKRTELHTRMRERRQRDLDRAGSSVRKLFSLFGL